MNVLVVYDSVFGNTEKVAQAIGSALDGSNQVQVVRVGELPPDALAGVDLLLAGSPTRAFSATPAIKGWLGSIPAQGLQGIRVAAFDTRIEIEKAPGFLKAMVKLFGYAAEPMAKRLQNKGGEQAAPPAWFIVEGSEGPLAEGELERAAAWAKQAAGQGAA